MTSLRSHALPVFTALLLLGQGPLCQLLCAPDAGAAQARGEAGASHDAMPPCHGGVPAPVSHPGSDGGSPGPAEHDCASCDQIAASAAGVAKDATSPGVLLVASATAYAPVFAPTAAPGLAPPDDRAPPGSSWGRALLLRKSSLLL